MKFEHFHLVSVPVVSPSVWREWIEIFTMLYILRDYASPSVWREWIEMVFPVPLW